MLVVARSVGIGSDYDGVETVPEGLEDVSKYPELVSLHDTRTGPMCQLITRSFAHVTE